MDFKCDLESNTLKYRTSLLQTVRLAKIHFKFYISVQASPCQQAGKAI